MSRLKNPIALVHKVLVTAAVCTIGLKSLSAAEPSDASFDDFIRANVLQAFSGISTLDIKFDVAEESKQPGQNRYEQRRWIQDLTSGVRTEEISTFLADKKTLRSFRIENWDGQRFLMWDRIVADRIGFRHIDSKFEYPGNALLAAQPSSKYPELFGLWLNVIDQIPIRQTLIDAPQAIRFVKGKENIDNRPTVEVNAPKFKMWVDAERGVPLRISYDFLDSQSNPYVGIQYEATGYERVGEVWLPKTIVLKQQSERVLPSVTTYHLDLSSAKVNAPIAKDALDVQLAPGVYVTDAIAKKTYTLSGLEQIAGKGQGLVDKLEEVLKEAESRKRPGNVK